MSNVILSEQAEGGVSITVFNTGEVNTPKGKVMVTEASVRAQVELANEGRPVSVVAKSVVDAKYAASPFRNAWKMNGAKNGIDTDIDKAKEQCHTCRRIKRDKQYQEVDGGSMYASLSPAGQGMRDTIKTDDDTMQADIDVATDEATLIPLYEAAIA